MGSDGLMFQIPDENTRFVLMFHNQQGQSATLNLNGTLIFSGVKRKSESSQPLSHRSRSHENGNSSFDMS